MCFTLFDSRAIWKTFYQVVNEGQVKREEMFLIRIFFSKESTGHFLTLLLPILGILSLQIITLSQGRLGVCRRQDIDIRVTVLKVMTFLQSNFSNNK